MKRRSFLASLGAALAGTRVVGAGTPAEVGTTRGVGEETWTTSSHPFKIGDRIYAPDGIYEVTRQGVFPVNEGPQWLCSGWVNNDRIRVEIL